MEYFCDISEKIFDMKAAQFLLILLLISSSIKNSSAQLMDEMFDSDLRSIGHIYGAEEQADGKTILVGDFNEFNGIPAKRIVRLNIDGSLDSNFDIGTGPDNDPYVTYIINVKIQDDGKIILVGGFSSFNGFACGRIVRLNIDGSVDESFTPPENLEQIGTIYYPLAIQLDNKVLYRQSVETNGTYPQKLIRLNSNGSIDDTFNAEFNGLISQVEVWSGDRILVGGNFNEYNGISVDNFVVLSNSGTIENSFAMFGAIEAFTVQVDDKIILSNNNGSTVRLNTNLTQDISFEYASTNGGIKSIDIDNNGKIIFGGSYGEVWRVNNDGTLDVTYSLEGASSVDIIYDVIALSSGEILATGSPSSLSKIVLRLTDNFLPDNTFDIGVGPTNQGQIIGGVVQSDGKTILAGDFTIYDGIEKMGIVRLNADLSIDDTFNSGSGISHRGLYFIEKQQDDKIILSGEFDKYNGIEVSGFIRLNKDGTLDDSYTASRIFGIRSVAIQEDNKLIVGRRYPNYVTRLNTDGTIDQSFQPELNNEIFNLALQPDGKILIGGTFTKVNGVIVPSGLIRLNSDGILDDSFESGITNTEKLRTILPQPDGKILLGGWFQDSEGVNNSCIRLLNNGDIDGDFTLSSKTSNNSISKITQLKDNSILVYNYGTDPNLIRLLPDGADYFEFIDVTLSSESGFGYASGIIPFSNSFLAYGYFSEIESLSINNLAHFIYTPLPAAPNAPMELSYTVDISGRPILNWRDNSTDENGFLISRIPNFKERAEVSSGITTFIDSEAESNISYTYRVASFNLGGTSYSNEINFQTGIITSIGEPSEQEIVSVYPNPGSGLFIINWNGTSNVIIKVLNQQGIVIQKLDPDLNGSKIDLTNYSNGMYLIQFIKGDESKYIRIVNQH
jgi:uncharacterized delta-60 repeat protein